MIVNETKPHVIQDRHSRGHTQIDWLDISILGAEDRISFEVKPDRYTWIQVVAGTASIDGQLLQSGDGIQISNPGDISIDR